MRRNSKTLRYTAKRYQVPGSRDTTASECQRRWLVRTSNRSYVFAGLPPHRSYRSRSAADCGTAVVGLGCSLYFLIANNQWVSRVVPIKIVLLHICVVSMYRALYVRTFHEYLSVLALPLHPGSSRRFIHSLRVCLTCSSTPATFPARCSPFNYNLSHPKLVWVLDESERQTRGLTRPAYATCRGGSACTILARDTSCVSYYPSSPLPASCLMSTYEHSRFPDSPGHSA